MRQLTALPVYNEVDHIDSVLDEILAVTDEVLVVDDGSTDGTSHVLARRSDIRRITHPANRGYGAALQSAFRYAQQRGFDLVVTIDADGQHDPGLIRDFFTTAADCDIVSGSRYLGSFAADSAAPNDRRAINQTITRELNELLGLRLTDTFCGFKAYRVDALARLQLTESGYALPLELWVQAAQRGLRIRELAVPRIYLDPSRSFGGSLDNPSQRLAYYRKVIADSLQRARQGAVWACDELAWAADEVGSPW